MATGRITNPYKDGELIMNNNTNEDYFKFLQSKSGTIIKSGFDIEESKLNPLLFPFQKFVNKRALKAGKYAIFGGTGTGKTPMQLDIADQVQKHTNGLSLILSPLAVSEQTINEGIGKFNINVCHWHENTAKIHIANYQQLHNIDTDKYNCICLDESSILKNETGAYRNLLIDTFKKTPYKYCFSATPSPNDPTELGNHAEFLDVCTYEEMLAMYFIHDAKNKSQQWRLKGHAIERFYEFVSNWAIMYSHPKDIGFDMPGFDLPELEIIERQVKTPLPEGVLFSGIAVNATDYNQSLRDTETERIQETISIIENESIKGDPILIWTKQNPEAENIYKQLTKLGYNCRNVQGSDYTEKKESDLLGFAKGEFQILITKESIASQGLNYQHCGLQIFNSVDFSFEKSYQGMRRSWRFGRKDKVRCYMITTDRMINVLKIQKEKHDSFENMQDEMTKAINKNLNNKLTDYAMNSMDIKTDNYWLMRGDNVQRMKEIKDKSIPLCIFSPPFADLFTYSNYVEDMGNVIDYDQFVEHFSYLVKELKRVIMPGRIIAVHCMNLPTLKSRDGFIGLRRFPDTIANIFESYGMFLHSEFTIWKDPLLAAVRTKTIGLAHKQLMKDSSIIRAGIPDKVLCFKTKEDNEVPIEHDLLDFYIPIHEFDTFPRDISGFNELYGYNPKSPYSKAEQYSHHIWQRYASPVWMDIDQTDTLQYMNARHIDDEKHICPLQLGVIDRVVLLYSKKGEIVLSPFGGIGSEGVQSIKRGRYSISIELKESYFEINKRNHNTIIEQKGQLKMFA
jgi:hypothetical protein